MKITLSSLMVDVQAKALAFYTDVLGFVKKTDIPLGEYRWLTVTSPEGHADVELVLEPNANPAGLQFQRAMYDGGIPATSFESVDLAAEHARLESLGVKFRQPATAAGPVRIAVFDDTCGNWIQLHQVGA